MFLDIHFIDYDIITNVINIWNVTNGRSSVNAKNKTLVPE